MFSRPIASLKLAKDSTPDVCLATASNTIGYTWQTAGAQAGGGAGSTKTVSANVTLDATQLAAAAADTYAGSFTVTITP